MENKIIVRIAEGLGNQFFMYAHAFALSKKINYNLYVDDKSGFIKTNNFRKFYLSEFNISSQIISNHEKFDTFFLNLKRNFLKKIDYFKKDKNFIIEKKNNIKITNFYNVNTNNLSKNVYVEGHFESEKYFIDYKEDLFNEFSFKDKTIFFKNNYYEYINKHSDRIVSICVRTNRYSERNSNKLDKNSITKSINFTRDTIEYIYRAIEQIEKKISNPIYLIWSNDFTGLREYFPEKKFIFIENNKNKIFQDFFLFQFCKNFIVGPTSFHWWGAWLNKSNNKLCFRPKNLNPSNNESFWPDSWISI